MAANFHIFTDSSPDHLHLKLDGDFDGTSAFELLHVLEKVGQEKRKIVIDTDGLKRIYPFGRETFWKNLHSVTNRTGGLVMTGKNDQQLAP
jgi:anti-anti-sigma regulatory factor